MKKSILLIGPFLFSLALQGEVKRLFIKEKPVTKTVRFSVFTEADYTKPTYKQSKAKVELSIWKYHSSEPELIWASTIDAGELKNYPNKGNQLYKEVSLPNIKDSKETLVAGYKIIYDTKGSRLSYDNGLIVSKGDTANTVKVVI